MDERPTHLDLFSGIGGFALAAQWAGFRTVAFCEIDPYCQAVLRKNFCAVADSEREQRERRRETGNMAGACRVTERETRQRERSGNAPCDSSPVIAGNIFDFDGTRYRGGVDLLTGGFPCQPFSVAGKRRGAADDRHLWPEMLRVIGEARPAWVLGENVPGIIPMELDNVLSALEAIGYACRSFVIPACAVDARHRRDRLWIVGRNVADTDDGEGSRFGQHGGKVLPEQESVRSSGGGSSVSHATQQPDERGIAQSNQWAMAGSNGESRCEWLAEPDVGRVAHGIPARVDRLRGLGNAIVPQVAFEILKSIRHLT
jgi:DNA (cytosine-5)-methyltransferase 1